MAMLDQAKRIGSPQRLDARRTVQTEWNATVSG
jgi:hypothetical protein